MAQVPQPTSGKCSLNSENQLIFLRASPPCWAIPGDAGELLQVLCDGKEFSVHTDLEEILPPGEDEASWSPARCISQAKRTSSLQCGRCGWDQPVPSCGWAAWPGHSFIPHLQILVSQSWCLELLSKGRFIGSGWEKKCHCCSVWGQEKAGWLITSAGHFFILQGIICCWINFLSCPFKRGFLFLLGLHNVTLFMIWLSNVLLLWYHLGCGADLGHRGPVDLGFWWSTASSHHPSTTLSTTRGREEHREAEFVL